MARWSIPFNLATWWWLKHYFLTRTRNKNHNHTEKKCSHKKQLKFVSQTLKRYICIKGYNCIYSANSCFFLVSLLQRTLSSETSLPPCISLKHLRKVRLKETPTQMQQVSDPGTSTTQLLLSKVQDFHYSIMIKLKTQKGSGWKGELAMTITRHRLSLGMF